MEEKCHDIQYRIQSVFFSAVLNGVTENRKLIIESKIFDLSKLLFHYNI